MSGSDAAALTGRDLPASPPAGPGGAPAPGRAVPLRARARAFPGPAPAAAPTPAPGRPVPRSPWPAGRLAGRLVGRLVGHLGEGTGQALAGERGRLVLWLPAAMIAGIALYFSLLSEPHPAWRGAGLPPLALAAWLARRRPHLAWGAALLGAAGLGFAAGSLATVRQSPPMAPPRTAVVVAGRVAAVDLLPEGRRVTLEAPRLGPDQPPEARWVRVRLRADDPARPAPGDALTVRALIRPPLAPTQPGGWDFQRNAFFSGLGGSGFALGPAAVTSGPAPPLAGLRALLEARVTGALPGAVGAIAAALLTGGVSAIPPADLAAMRDSGLAHLLSVSGLHVAIVMGLTFGAARFVLALWRPLALRVPGKAAAALLSLAMGAAYMVLTGSQVPMQRSVAMAALVTLGVLAGRRALGPRGLALAAALVALLQPVAVLGPSFQMSFGAVLALIAGWEALRPAMERLRGEGQWWRRGLLAVAGLTLTSVLAGAATTPFGLHHFGRVQLYGVAANALAVPVTSVLVMPAGLLAAALMPFGLEAWALAPMGWGVGAVLWTARTVAAWPGAAVSTEPMPGWGLALASLGLLWLCLWRGRWRLWGVAGLALGLLSPLAHAPPDLLVSADGRLVALRTAGGAFVQRLPGASAIARESFLRGWGEAAGVPFPREGEAAAGAVACVPAACTLRPHPDGPAAALVREARPPVRGAARRAPLPPAPGICGAHAVVVSAEPVRGRCAGSAVVDRFSVWRDGAHAVWLGPGGARVVSDRAWRGERPWVPPPPRPRAPEEPTAPLDE